MAFFMACADGTELSVTSPHSCGFALQSLTYNHNSLISRSTYLNVFYPSRRKAHLHSCTYQSVKELSAPKHSKLQAVATTSAPADHLPIPYVITLFLISKIYEKIRLRKSVFIKRTVEKEIQKYHGQPTLSPQKTTA